MQVLVVFPKEENPDQDPGCLEEGLLFPERWLEWLETAEPDTKELKKIKKLLPVGSLPAEDTGSRVPFPSPPSLQAQETAAPGCSRTLSLFPCPGTCKDLGRAVLTLRGVSSASCSPGTTENPSLKPCPQLKTMNNSLRVWSNTPPTLFYLQGATSPQDHLGFSRAAPGVTSTGCMGVL